MSRYFVTDAPVPVYEFDAAEVLTDAKPNVIWIKPKMDVATKGKVTSEMFSMGKGGELEAKLGANETALLLHNVVRWEGPDFDAVPCTPENIRKLDPTEPHVAAVLEAIAERNKSPKVQRASATPSTSTNAGATDSLIRPSRTPSLSAPLANGQLKSPLLSALDGRLNRSDD